MFSSESRALQRWIRDASAGVFAGAVCVERPQIRREAVRWTPRAAREAERRVECIGRVDRVLDAQIRAPRAALLRSDGGESSSPCDKSTTIDELRVASSRRGVVWPLS